MNKVKETLERKCREANVRRSGQIRDVLLKAREVFEKRYDLILDLNGRVDEQGLTNYTLSFKLEDERVVEIYVSNMPYSLDFLADDHNWSFAFSIPHHYTNSDGEEFIHTTAIYDPSACRLLEDMYGGYHQKILNQMAEEHERKPVRKRTLKESLLRKNTGRKRKRRRR